MSDIEKIILTSVVTIIGGSFVFVFGQLFLKRLIEPCTELRKEISKVRFTLSYFAPIINTPISRTPERSEEAAKALRENSANLFALSELTPKSPLLRWLSFASLPEMENILEAAKNLRALSTFLHETGEKASDSLELIFKITTKIETLLLIDSEIKT